MFLPELARRRSVRQPNRQSRVEPVPVDGYEVNEETNLPHCAVSILPVVDLVKFCCQGLFSDHRWRVLASGQSDIAGKKRAVLSAVVAGAEA